MLQKKFEKAGLDHFVDSAGTSNHHAGEQPDSRMMKTASDFNFPIDHLRSRQFTSKDFNDFDIIYAMDKSNVTNILSLAKSNEDRKKVKMILNESHPGKDLEVPDPYFGGDRGFIESF